MEKAFDIEELIRPNIRELDPYHSARADFDEGLLLDANENSLGAPFSDNDQLHRYPSPVPLKLQKLIADWRGLQPENVFVGSGSDEAIDLLYRIFCRPGKDRVLTTAPTYGMYKVSAKIHDIQVDEVLLSEPDFQPRVDEILDAATPNTKLLFLCSPNNPTGNVFHPDSIKELTVKFPGIVVVDEAYIDFSGQESQASKVAEFSNLVVLQTMSKSFGLAGIRLGIAFASDDIIRYMIKVKAPYNLNKFTVKAAEKAFDNLDTIRCNIEAIKAERKKLSGELKKLAAVEGIYPSETNFLLAKMEPARKIYGQLTDEGIIVRYRGDEPLCENCLRITVGTPDENERLISALKRVSA